MDKLTGIKIKYNDGTYSDQIPVGALAANIGWDNVYTLMNVIGDVDMANDGSLQDQITKRNNYIRFHADYSDPQSITTNNSTGRRIASGQGAVAMGVASISSGDGAFTGGIAGRVSSQNKRYASEATGDGSVAWNGALASATNAFAFGGTMSNDYMQTDNTSPEYGRTVVSGIGSVALGGSANKSTGGYSFVGGQNSWAEHNLSFAYGNRVRSGKASQTVFGKYNAIDKSASLVIGNGSGASDSERANVFTTGNDTVNNYITIGAKKITDTDAGILKKLTPSRNLCVVDTAHDTYITKPSFWTLGSWQGVWANSKGFTCNRPSYWTLTDGGGFWYHLQAGTYTFGCNINYNNTTTTQVYYIIQFVPDSDTTTVTNLTEYKLTETLAQRIEETFTLSEAGTFIFRPTSYATSGGTSGEYQTRYEYIQIEVGNMATEYEALRDYYTIGDALIATGATTPISTLTGNIYMANGYGYGPDSATFSKFITKSDLTDETATYPRIARTVPYLNYQIVECTNDFNSLAYEAYLKYIVANFASLIDNQPFFGEFYSGDTALIYGFVENATSSSAITTEGLPLHSKCLIVRNNGDLYTFGTQNGSFYFNAVGGNGGSYLPLSGGIVTGPTTFSGGITFSGVQFDYSGMESGTTDTARNVWFSDASTRGKPCYNDKLKYNPSTDVLTVGSISGNAANVTGTVAIGHGGTGLTSSPSMLINLASTTAANVLQASPRPGVTGTLGVGNGGTGQTSLQATRNAMGLGNTTGALPVANGGTGLTSSPSMLTNLASTSAANVLAASPRPGVTGTLPIGNGGTGATNVSGARTNLGIGTTSLYDGSLTSGSATLTNGMTYNRLLICGKVGTNPYFWTSMEVPTAIITASDQGFVLTADDSYCSFNLKSSGNNVIMTWRGMYNSENAVKRVFGVN